MSGAHIYNLKNIQWRNPLRSFLVPRDVVWQAAFVYLVLCGVGLVSTGLAVVV